MFPLLQSGSYTDFSIFNLVHIYHFDIGAVGSGRSRPGTVFFRNPVTYIINNKDTITLQPNLKRPFSPPLAPFDVYKIITPADSSIRIRFIANEYRQLIDTTYELKAGMLPPDFLFFFVFPNHSNFLRKKNRAKCEIYWPPHFNAFLRKRIYDRMDTSIKKTIFIGNAIPGKT